MADVRPDLTEVMKRLHLRVLTRNDVADLCDKLNRFHASATNWEIQPQPRRDRLNAIRDEILFDMEKLLRERSLLPPSEETPTRPLQAGDVVRLKSGGPMMTITGPGSDETCVNDLRRCEWFEERGDRHWKRRFEGFPVASLELVPPEAMKLTAAKRFVPLHPCDVPLPIPMAGGVSLRDSVIDAFENPHGRPPK